MLSSLTLDRQAASHRRTLQEAAIKETYAWWEANRFAQVGRKTTRLRDARRRQRYWDKREKRLLRMADKRWRESCRLTGVKQYVA